MQKMNPFLILTIIDAALAAAPKAIQLAGELKQFVSNLFGAKLITKSEQDALHHYVDAREALVLAGIVPSHWKVEPDPVDTPVLNMPVDPTKDVTFRPSP